jgi:hypothetical protein
MFGQRYERATFDLRQLYQGETWTGADGITHQIEDMTESHLANVLGWLDRRAVDLDLADAMSSIWAAPPDRYFDWETEVCERDPHEWVRGLEVYMAMKRRLSRYESERTMRVRKSLLAGTIHADYIPS